MERIYLSKIGKKSPEWEYMYKQTITRNLSRRELVPASDEWLCVGANPLFLIGEVKPVGKKHYFLKKASPALVTQNSVFISDMDGWNVKIPLRGVYTAPRITRQGLADKTGVRSSAISYWLKEGLFEESVHYEQSGKRGRFMFINEPASERVQKINELRDRGFSIETIKNL